MERLVAAGGRRTRTRQAIVEVVVGQGGHITADEIAERVKARHPRVNLSTVYRTLETLEELDVVDHVHLGHGRALYHLTERGHQHLYCERCERVESLPIERLHPLREMLEDGYGFRLDERHFALVGRCARCRAAEDG